MWREAIMYLVAADAECFVPEDPYCSVLLPSSTDYHRVSIVLLLVESLPLGAALNASL